MDYKKGLVIITIAWVTALSSYAADQPLDSEKLYGSIFKELTNSSIKLPQDVCAKAAGRISVKPECINATNAAALQTSLTNAFKTAVDLDWTKNNAALTGVANQVASNLFEAPAQRIQSLDPEKLYNAIFRELTNSLTKVPQETCAKAAGRISVNPECINATNAAALQTSLTNAFKTAVDLDWTNNNAILAGVAVKVSSELFNGSARSPVTTYDKLYKALSSVLSASLPRLNTSVIAGAASATAQNCSVAMSTIELSDKLETELTVHKPLGLDKDVAARKKVIGDTLFALFPSTSWRAIPKLKDNQNGSPWQVTIWAGARMDDPYSINISNRVAQLTPAGSTSDGYIEFELNNRYVIRNLGSDDLIIPFFGGKPTRPDGIPHFFWPWETFPDLDARVGYTFRGSSSPTNFNVSTVAGGSDIYGDTSVGFPYAQVAGTNDSWKGQLTVEVAGGVATDEQRLDLHPNFFAGLGSQASFRAKGFGSTNYQGYWYGRAGVALIDEPSLISGTNIVNLNGLQQPEFNLKWVPAVGTTVVYPLNSWLSLQGGFNAYFTKSPPAEWNLNIGVTVNIDQVFGSLLGKSGSSGSP